MCAMEEATILTLEWWSMKVRFVKESAGEEERFLIATATRCLKESG